MSSEPRRQSAPEPRRRPQRTEDPGAWRPDPARDNDLAAAELADVLGYDPDDPATWPGNAPAGSAAVTAPVEAPDDDDVVRLTDATAMRAVAHPVRMALIELFEFRETLTATQASELLGESPANCAFHLRTLAKYGFVREAGGGKGRERPWALVHRRVNVTTDQADPQAALAAGELTRHVFERWVDRARRLWDPRNQVPGWDKAQGWDGFNLFLTRDEVIQLRTEIRRMLLSYEYRLTDPARRPEGALPVEWMIFTSPVPEAADLADAANPRAAREHHSARTPAPGADARDADDPDATDS